MPVNPSAVLVLVCPQCGKKYKGDANRPDARYECPVDQSTLIRLDMQAIAAVRQARQPGAAAAKPTKSLRLTKFIAALLIADNLS